MTGLTLEDQIELVRTLAMLCAKQGQNSGFAGRGWQAAGRRWDVVRERLENELAESKRPPPEWSPCDVCPDPATCDVEDVCRAGR